MSKLSKWLGVHFNPLEPSKGVRFEVPGFLKNSDTSDDKNTIPSWGEFGRGLGQSGIAGLLTYLLSSGDRNKKKQLENILMEMVKAKSLFYEICRR